MQVMRVPERTNVGICSSCTNAMRPEVACRGYRDADSALPHSIPNVAGHGVPVECLLSTSGYADASTTRGDALS